MAPKPVTKPAGAGRPRPSPKSSAKGAASAATPDAKQTANISVPLALLKYFYWIEIGIRSYMRSRGNVEFSRAEGLVIATVMLGYARPSDISRQLGLSRQAVHTTIHAMRKKGIIDLAPDPEDGRIKQVVLTDLANKMNQDGIVAMDYMWRELGQRIGQRDLELLSKVMRKNWGPPILFDEGEHFDPWSE